MGAPWAECESYEKGGKRYFKKWTTSGLSKLAKIHPAAPQEESPISENSAPKQRANVGTAALQKIDPDDVEIIKLKASEAMYDVGLILKRFKVQSIEELNTTQGETAIKSLNTKIDEKRIAAEQGKE
jgi:hypothetical protein